MTVEERVRSDWQRRFGLLSSEQAQQWHGPIVSMSGAIATAEVEAILRYRRTQQLYGDTLREHAGYSALSRLFSNGIRVAREIGSLIESGYPAGACARWRTLHETMVVAQFIRSNSPRIGEGYRDHACIRAYKNMTRVRGISERYRKPLPPGFLETYERLKKEHDALIGKYGPAFKNDYGWAAAAIKGRPTLSDLEKAVEMDYMRGVYSDVSEHIHSGPASLPWHLDPAERDDVKHLFGPNADGSCIPGILVAHTFSNLRIVWRVANESNNPFLAPDLLEKDVARIHREGNDLMREFVDCESSVEHMLVATQLLETLTPIRS